MGSSTANQQPSLFVIEPVQTITLTSNNDNNNNGVTVMNTQPHQIVVVPDSSGAL